MKRTLKFRLLPLALAAAGLLHGTGASALGLMQAYEAALQNDPAYRAAYYSAEGGKENRKLGLANLLPQVSGSYSANRNRNTVTYTGHAPIAQDYFGHSAGVQLRQPIVNLDGIARYKQGVAQSQYAEAQFASQQQEVITRVVGAYLDALLKNEVVTLAKGERDMYAEQRKVNDHLFQRGEGTRTDMLETQARLDASEAQVLETQDALDNARDTLARIIGGDVGTLDTLDPNFQVRPSDEMRYEAWQKIALERNPDIKTLEYNREIARQEVNKARAGHAPRLDFIGTYSKNSSDSVNTYNQDTTVRSIGVQLNIPLYSGGSVNAQTRQAVAGQEKASADLQAQTDKVLIELRKDYNALQSSVSRIAALLKSVESARLLVKATEQSVKGGVRINLDVLNAQQQLFASQRDLAQARYNYLITSLRMRAATGLLSVDDVRQTAQYFH